MILHTLSTSEALRDCQRLCSGEDVVLCLDDSVYCLRDTPVSREQLKGNSDITFKVLASDLTARGLEPDNLLPDIEICEDDAYLTLSMQAGKVIHWG